MIAPSPFSALPPTHSIDDAAPKCISRRTSYIRVRLAFHRYPQFIRRVFNRGRFGPPRSFTCASACPWLGHPVSGLLTVTKFALFRLAFAMPPSDDLSLQQPITRWIVLQKARRHPRRGSDSLYAHNFRFYFTPLPGFFSPFPHGTCTLSIVRYI